VQSLRRYNKTDDILVLVDAAFESVVRSKLPDIIVVSCPNSPTPETASMRKLHIFDIDVSFYDKVLFIDCDILIHTDITTIMTGISDTDILYVYSEKDSLEEHKHIYWSLKNYTSEQYRYFQTNDIKVFNAGLFGFKPSDAMKVHFSNIKEIIRKHTGAFFYEQSFMNYYFNLNNKTDRVLFTKRNYIMFPSDNVNYEGKIIHFCGGPGDAETKYRRMIHYFNKFITSIMSTGIAETILSKHLTMVSKERLLNLYNQCLKFRDTTYSFVECGVAKGGCLAMMASVAGENNRIYGFDSFEGLPDVVAEDFAINRANPKEWVNKNLSEGIKTVYATFNTLKLDMKNVFLVKGFFKETLCIKENIDNIGKIGVLRVDGDWYESTKICLEKLYDRVVVGGVIIIDDYGHWIGAQRATDEFRETHHIKSPLIQTDYTEFYWIKTE
jgi:hypothetical protein